MKFYSIEESSLKLISVLNFARLNVKTIVFISWDKVLNYFIEYILSLKVFTFVVTFEQQESDLTQLKSFTELHNQSLFVYPTNFGITHTFDCASCLNCCLLNTEQMSVDYLRADVVNYLKNGGKIINYSKENENLLQCLTPNQTIYLPYVCTESEQSQLTHLLTNTSKSYDYAVVGGITLRRRRIIDELLSRGIKILIIQNCFGLERDKQIAQCRALLNIHGHDNYTVYESIRCTRWLAAGMTVLTEHCSDQQIFVPPAKTLFMIDSEHLIDVCIRFVTDGAVDKNCELITESEPFNVAASLSLINKLTEKNYDSRPRTKLEFVYGKGSRLTNITEKARDAFYVKSEESYRIDFTASFNSIFGDVCSGVEKNLYILFCDIKISLPEIRQENYTIREIGNQIIIEKK